MEQLKQAVVDAAKVAGGEGECAPGTATLNAGIVTTQGPAASFGDTLVYTYEGLIQATSYALERVINAVNSN